MAVSSSAVMLSDGKRAYAEEPEIYGLRRTWYNCFDPTLAEARRAEAHANIRNEFRYLCLLGGKPRSAFPERVRQRFLSLPSDIVIAPIMVRGYMTGIVTKVHIDAETRSDHKFMFVGYSTGKHSNGGFRDGSSACGKVMIADSDMELVAANPRILLVDGAIQSGRTVHSVVDHLIGIGAKEIHVYARHNVIFAMRQKSLIAKLHPALASVIR